MTPYLFFPFAPAPSCWLFLICGPWTCPPPSGPWDVLAAMMIAWRASLPDCLLMAKLSMPSPRCRLVGRSEGRAVFVLGSVLAICPVLVLVSLPRLVGAAHVLGVLLR